MRVGLDQFTLHPYKNGDPFFAIQWARDHGLDGVQFGGVRSLSAELDPGRLRDIQAECARHGLYSLISIGSPNPHIGKGGRDPDQIVTDLTKQIEVAGQLGWRELHSSMGGLDERKCAAPPWPEHLRSTVNVLTRLRPVLRHWGCRINLENHGDATTFELVRIAQQVGADVAGVCLDTANVLCHAEDPLEAVRRAAPYVHQTHVKDAIIYFSANGYTRQGRPPGQGVIPWAEVLAALAAFSPDLCLSIEDHKWQWEFRIFDADWLALHPDIAPAELGKVCRTAWQITQRITTGELPDPQAYESTPYIDEAVPRVCAGRDHLQAVVRAMAASPV